MLLTGPLLGGRLNWQRWHRSMAVERVSGYYRHNQSALPNKSLLFVGCIIYRSTSLFTYAVGGRNLHCVA